MVKGNTVCHGQNNTACEHEVHKEPNHLPGMSLGCSLQPHQLLQDILVDSRQFQMQNPAVCLQISPPQLEKAAKKNAENFIMTWSVWTLQHTFFDDIPSRFRVLQMAESEALTLWRSNSCFCISSMKISGECSIKASMNWCKPYTVTIFYFDRRKSNHTFVWSGESRGGLPINFRD